MWIAPAAEGSRACSVRWSALEFGRRNAAWQGRQTPETGVEKKKTVARAEIARGRLNIIATSTEFVGWQ